MRYPEVRQRLGVHPDAAAQPLKGDVLLAQPRQLAGAADPSHGCVKPQRQQDTRVRWRMPGPALHRLDRAVQGRNVQPFDEAPHQAHPMVVRHQSLEVHRAKRNLPPLRRAKPGTRNARPLRSRLNRQSFDQLRTVILRHIDNTMRLPMAILTNPILADSQNPSPRQNIFRL